MRSAGRWRRLLDSVDQGRGHRRGDRRDRRARAGLAYRHRHRAEPARRTRTCGGRRFAPALAQTGLAGEIAAISVAGQQHGLVCLDASRGTPASSDALERHTLGSRRGPARRGARRRHGLGGPDRSRSRRVVHRFQVGLGEAARARGRGADRGRSACPTTTSPNGSAGEGVTDRGDASGTAWWSTATGSTCPRCWRCRSWIFRPELLPRVLGPTEPAGAVTAAAAAATGLPVGATRRARHGRQHGRGAGIGAAARRAGAQPRHVRHGVHGLFDADRGLDRERRGFRRRLGPIPAAGGHSQLHARRGPGGGLVRPGPQRRRSEQRRRGAALLRRRAHAQRARRGRGGLRPAPRHRSTIDPDGHVRRARS